MCGRTSTSTTSRTTRSTIAAIRRSAARRARRRSRPARTRARAAGAAARKQNAGCTRDDALSSLPQARGAAGHGGRRWHRRGRQARRPARRRRARHRDRAARARRCPRQGDGRRARVPAERPRRRALGRHGRHPRGQPRGRRRGNGARPVLQRRRRSGGRDRLPRRRRAARRRRDRDLDRRRRAGARGPAPRGARGTAAARSRELDRGRRPRSRAVEARSHSDARAPPAAAARARPHLREVRMSGFVSLVGAGPGDAELLTLRALRRLREADLVLNDALVQAELLELAPQAQRFYVGKRAGRHSIDQDGINGLLVRAARRGQRVVRLKAGDPFVLGRGGEEALALEDAGVAYEVVPGVSSAIAAPALAGIPVTHRGVASGFAVVSGHAESAYGPILDGLAPNALTIVVLMGVATRGAIAARLVARGWSPATPAAVVLGASHPGSFTWAGDLAALGDASFATELPGVLGLGAVVELAA